MVHSAVFAVSVIALLSLTAGHPAPDYRPKKKHASRADVLLQSPRIPLLKEYDFVKQQGKQDFPSLGEVFGPIFAGLITPFSTVSNGLSDGIGSALSDGFSTITDVAEDLTDNRSNRSSEESKSYVVNMPLSSLPYTYLTDKKYNRGVPHVSPYTLPFPSRIAIPLRYPTIIHGNVQHYTSSHHVLVPLLPIRKKIKEDVKPIKEESVESVETVENVEEPSEPSVRSRIVIYS